MKKEIRILEGCLTDSDKKYILYMLKVKKYVLKANKRLYTLSQQSAKEYELTIFKGTKYTCISIELV